MNRTVRRKRILIVLAWLVFLAVSGLLFSAAARSFFFGRAKTELLAQAQDMEKQIIDLAQNDLYTERDAVKIKAAKIRTLGFALEQ